MVNKKKDITDGYPLRCLAIGDIHFGIKNSEKLYEELNNVFIKYLEDNGKDVDMIFFVGDYFDKKLSLNETASKLAIRFMDKVVELADKFNIKIRMIKGTLSHDFTQLENFKHYELKHDFKIFNTATIENLTFVYNKNETSELSIFYVPEEYMEDQNEFYKDFVDVVDDETKFDLMIGHGTWDFTAFLNQKIDSERSIKNAPVYKYDEWKDLTYGPCIFGHIHVRQNKGKKVYYTGSFSRWQHGEDKPKGFLDVTYNLDTTESKIRFVENYEALEYVDLLLEDDTDTTIQDKIQSIEEVLNEGEVIRLDVNNGLSTDEIAIIKEYFNNNDKISFVQKNTKFDNSEELEKDKKYSFIIDENLTKEAKIQKYIEIEFGTKINQKDILEICKEV